MPSAPTPEALMKGLSDRKKKGRIQALRLHNTGGSRHKFVEEDADGAEATAAARQCRQSHGGFCCLYAIVMGKPLGPPPSLALEQ